MGQLYTLLLLLHLIPVMMKMKMKKMELTLLVAVQSYSTPSLDSTIYSGQTLKMDQVSQLMLIRISNP